MRGRYLVEIGHATDMHGGNMTKVCQRALRDAMSHCCMCGIHELLGVQGHKAIRLSARVGCTSPGDVQREQLMEFFAGYGYSNDRVELEVVSGGLQATGIYVPQHGKGTQIEVAVAAISVWICTEV